jgi:hypothetical protein
MRKFWFTTALLGLTACDLAPDFKKPELAVPEVFKEASVAPNVAEPAEPTGAPASDGKWKRVDDKAHIEEFAWWRMFHDEALNALEDAGYYCVDNLPPELLIPFVRLEEQQKEQRLAIAIDVRSAKSLHLLPEQIVLLRDMGMTVKSVFLDASSDT